MLRFRRPPDASPQDVGALSIPLFRISVLPLRYSPTGLPKVYLMVIPFGMLNFYDYVVYGVRRLTTTLLNIRQCGRPPHEQLALVGVYGPGVRPGFCVLVLPAAGWVGGC